MPRPRKPTALKVLGGAQPCRINRSEPEPSKGIGTPPNHLDDLAVEVWIEIAAAADEMGILTVADRDAVALYCVAKSRWMLANATVDDEGLTVGSQRGDLPNPHIAIADACHKQMVRLLGQFGMTPSSRSALKVGSKAQDDPVAAFLANAPNHAKPAKAKA